MTQVVRVRPLVGVQASDLPFYVFACLFVYLVVVVVIFWGGGGWGGGSCLLGLGLGILFCFESRINKVIEYLCFG